VDERMVVPPLAGQPPNQRISTVGDGHKAITAAIQKQKMRNEPTNPLMMSGFTARQPFQQKIGFVSHARPISKLFQCFQLDGPCFAFFFLIGVHPRPSVANHGNPGS